MLPENYVSPAVLAGTDRSEGVLLGLSGGADSASLLDMLVKDGIAVTVCHINHCIRGEESDRDEKFCRALAASHGLEITVFRRNVPEIAAASGEGLEEAARRIRYECFSSLMDEKNIKILCTAHNANDNAETVLFNIIRGASARGGCGIPAVRGMGDGKIVVRPILRISKPEILDYCRKNGLEFVTDSTNSDDTYSRNRLRLRALPELCMINPDAVDAITRFSDALTLDCGYLDGEAGKFVAEQGAEITAGSLRGLPGPVLVRVLALCAKRAGARPEKVHIDALAGAIAAGEKISVTMPGGIIASFCLKNGLTFAKDERIKKKRG